MLRRLLVLLLALALAPAAMAGKAPAYTYVRVGNTVDVAPATTPGVVRISANFARARTRSPR
jgi:hypothetical protein